MEYLTVLSLFHILLPLFNLRQNRLSLSSGISTINPECGHHVAERAKERHLLDFGLAKIGGILYVGQGENVHPALVVRDLEACPLIRHLPVRTEPLGVVHRLPVELYLNHAR